MTLSDEMCEAQSVRVLVTGASSGIGEAFARRYARDGYDCILVGRNAVKLDELVGELRRNDVECEALVADLSDTQSPGSKPGCRSGESSRNPQVRPLDYRKTTHKPTTRSFLASAKEFGDALPQTS